MKPRLYVPLDVDYLDDEKFDDVSAEAELLYLRSLCLCKRRVSDGHIATKQLRRLSDRMESPPADLADELVAAGLWGRTDAGWIVVAYLKHNPSTADIEQKRRTDAERKAAARGEGNGGGDVSARTGNVSARTTSVSQRTGGVSQRTTSVSSTNRGNSNTEAEAEAAAEPDVHRPVDNMNDHDRTIELLLLRRRRHAERSGKTIDNLAAWSRSVRAGLETEHGDRIDGDLALGLSPDTIAAGILPDRSPDPPMAAHHKLDTNAVMARALALVAPEDR